MVTSKKHSIIYIKKNKKTCKSKVTVETVQVDRKWLLHRGVLSRLQVGGMGKKITKSSVLPVLTEVKHASGVSIDVGVEAK